MLGFHIFSFPEETVSTHFFRKKQYVKTIYGHFKYSIYFSPLQLFLYSAKSHILWDHQYIIFFILDLSLISLLQLSLAFVNDVIKTRFWSRTGFWMCTWNIWITTSYYFQNSVFIYSVLFQKCPLFTIWQHSSYVYSHLRHLDSFPSIFPVAITITSLIL